MRFQMVFLAAMFTLGATVATANDQAKTQKPKPKQSTTAPTKGTAQLPGDNGKVGVTYQLGEKGSELHFTLDSATFQTHFPAPDDTFVAGAGERLLVLNFTVQNPLNKEMKLGSSSFQFTVVSAEDENFEFRGYLLHGTKRTHLDQSLKPAQKVKATVVIPIFSSGPVPKVMVQRGNAPLLRYDLTGKVGKLTSVFSPDGVDLVENGGTLALGKTAEMGPLGVTVDSVVLTSEAIRGYKPTDGSTYLVVKVTFKNLMQKPTSVGFQFFRPEVTFTDGVLASWNSSLIESAADPELSMEIPVDGFVQGRYFFVVPAGKQVKQIKLTHNATKRFITVNGPG